MIGVLIVVLTMPVLVAFLVHQIMKPDNKKLTNSEELYNMRVRFFRLKKPTMVLCTNHLYTLKVGQIALVNGKACKVCVDTGQKLP